MLEAGCNVVGVVTNPDKPAGRGQKILSSAVKQFAEAKGLPILQPTKFRNEQFLQDLAQWKADLQIVVAFKMLPEVVWAMPKLGTINLHASLLPQYRGAAPINHAIINGETVTGVTTFLLEREIDTGNILLQEEIAISDTDTAGSLHDKLMQKGAKLVVETVELLSSGNYAPIPQKEAKELKAAPKIFKKDCKINWEDSGENIYNFIRGLSPYPAAWTTLETERKAIDLKIYEAVFEPKQHCEQLGKVLSDNKTFFKIVVTNGYISVRKLQQAGKRAMCVEDFLKGFNLEPKVVR